MKFNMVKVEKEGVKGEWEALSWESEGQRIRGSENLPVIPSSRLIASYVFSPYNV
jgi:hypothetical protein